MENERVFCQPEKIEKYFNELEETLRLGIQPEFIFNIDESCFHEWVDSRRLQCNVPSSHEKSAVKMPRKRSIKSSTILDGICADGFTISPIVIITRDSIEKELLCLGYTPDKVVYGKSDTDCMNQKLFMMWAKTILSSLR